MDHEGSAAAQCRRCRRPAVPANGGNIYDHFAVSYAFPNGYRAFLANRQSTGCFNGTLDYMMGTEGTMMLGAGKARIEGPDGQINWRFEGQEDDMYQGEHDVLFASIRAGKPKNDDLNWPPVRCWRSWAARPPTRARR